LLCDRGLIINDLGSTQHFLNFVGYDRLAGYWRILQKDTIKHTFLEGSTFSQVVDIYSFDRELRFLVFDAIKRFEVSLRTVINNQMCIAYGPCWYSDSNLCNNHAFYNENIAFLNDELKQKH
jgi:abortive infection bacteriophage resistance protein